MTAALTTAGWPGRSLLDGAGEGRGALLREGVQGLAWAPALRLFCRPFVVEGAAADGPCVYAANHASHADTAAVRAALGRAARRRLAVGAAEDYFFTTRARAAGFTVAVGAFPFPRSGDEGLRRAAELLTAGWSVLLYPQGTRSGDGRYRPGALRLAADGWPVVPVGIAGTDAILPKGARFPRRAATAVVIGAPLKQRALTGPSGMDAFVDGIDRAAARAQHLVAG